MGSIFHKHVVHSVECDDLADLILYLYGRRPEIEATLELNDDDTFEISAKACDFNQQVFDSWLKKPKFERSEIYMLMNKLAADNHIEDGDFLIKTN